MLGQLQHGPVALAARGAVEAVGPVVVDPLVVAEVPGQAERLPAQVAHVALLPVDSHVVAQGHVVSVGFAAKVTPMFFGGEGGDKKGGETRQLEALIQPHLASFGRNTRVWGPHLKSPILWVSLWLSRELACL